MNKVTLQGAIFGGLTLFGAVSPLNAATGTLPLDTRCEATSARVHVAGFKDRTGNLRIQAYGGNPSEFLENGKKLVRRSEEHTSELQSLIRTSYAVFCVKKKINKNSNHSNHDIYKKKHTNSHAKHNEYQQKHHTKPHNNCE